MCAIRRKRTGKPQTKIEQMSIRRSNNFLPSFCSLWMHILIVENPLIRSGGILFSVLRKFLWTLYRWKSKLDRNHIVLLNCHVHLVDCIWSNDSCTFLIINDYLKYNWRPIGKIEEAGTGCVPVTNGASLFHNEWFHFFHANDRQIVNGLHYGTRIVVIQWDEEQTNLRRICVVLFMNCCCF